MQRRGITSDSNKNTREDIRMKHHVLSLLRDVRNRHVLGFDLIMFCCIPALALMLRVDTLEQMGQYVLPLALYTSLSIVWKMLVFFPSDYTGDTGGMQVSMNCGW